MERDDFGLEAEKAGFRVYVQRAVLLLVLVLLMSGGSVFAGVCLYKGMQENLKAQDCLVHFYQVSDECFELQKPYRESLEVITL